MHSFFLVIFSKKFQQIKFKDSNYVITYNKIIDSQLIILKVYSSPLNHINAFLTNKRSFFKEWSVSTYF